MSSVSSLLIGGRYRLVERVGVGGTATVYRARDERLKRDVAVKLLAEWLRQDPVAVRRFRREAELTAGLAHPNIVAILDAGSEPQDFIVMELVHGLDAGTVLQRQGRLDPDTAVHVVSQVCDGLEHAHDHDVVHHDVSPRNILIERAGASAKLADFGLASGVIEATSGRTAEVMGTPGYVAPEILCGGSPSPLSDLYSVGVVAHRFLAGLSRGRAGKGRATAPLATARPRVPRLAEVRPDLPSGLTDAVQKALAQEPGARQGSVAEFRAQLVDGQRAPLRLRSVPAAASEPAQARLPNAA